LGSTSLRTMNNQRRVFSGFQKDAKTIRVLKI
jgi:hypothetical protein